MYLHLGNNVIIPEETIIGILDYEKIKNVKINKKYFSNTQNKKKTIKVGDDEEYKTVVITADKIYLTAISQPTIKKRLLNKKLELIVQQ